MPFGVLLRRVGKSWEPDKSPGTVSINRRTSKFGFFSQACMFGRTTRVVESDTERKFFVDVPTNAAVAAGVGRRCRYPCGLNMVLNAQMFVALFTGTSPAPIACCDPCRIVSSVPFLCLHVTVPVDAHGTDLGCNLVVFCCGVTGHG